jgi:hypothetical protein
MDKEYLSWFGNVINFLIVIFLIVVTVNTECFNFSYSLIAIFGVAVSLFIQLRNNLIRGQE